MTAILQALFANGLKTYYAYEEYTCQNEVQEDKSLPVVEEQIIVQPFLAKGNILNSVSLYIGSATESNMEIQISDESGRQLSSTIVCTNQLTEHAWNQIGLATTSLKREQTYRLTLFCKDGLHSVYYSPDSQPEVFLNCFNDSHDMDGCLVAGFQFYNRKLAMKGIIKIAFKIGLSLMMGLSLCYAVFHLEKLAAVFKKTRKKRALLYATYFSVSMALFYNPLEPGIMEVTAFDRTIGIGLMANVDVASRISSFRHWFVMLGVSFVLFYLLANAFLQTRKSPECVKMQSFLDSFIILANCTLFFRCLRYFVEVNSYTPVNFSAYIVVLIAVAGILYILLQLDRHITTEMYAQWLLCGASVSFPVSVFIEHKLGNGTVGFFALFVAAIALICRLVHKNFSASKTMEAFSAAAAVLLSCFPLMTSVCIESVHILNQYRIFLAHPARYYGIVCLVFVLIGAGVLCIIRKTQAGISDWKKWCYPFFILGIDSLSKQIPLSQTFSPHLYETANCSVLISDFFNYGKIPIVEHYGGHMMSAVWEGLLYGLLNRDYTGAMESPYSGMMLLVVSILFYVFLKSIWNQDVAFLAVLVFPFYDTLSYFGLGLLVCLAAMYYVKKNTYKRAAVLWGAFIWCALYRLDLGFAFGIAVVLKDNCIGCGTCERHCPSGAIQMVDGRPAVNEAR